MTHDQPAHASSTPSAFLLRHADAIERTAQTLGLPVLDLACGSGANGLYLAARGLDVVLVDASAEALDRARERAARQGLRATFLRMDLEQGGDPLADVAGGRGFAAILVFRYLHRPLFPAIRRAVAPGGCVLYETYTVGQRAYGKPRNPDFLLEPGELPGRFAGWRIEDSYEAVLKDPPRAMAGVLACKPADEPRGEDA